MTDESFGVHLAAWLAAKGIDVVAFDPSGAPSAARQVSENVRLAESIAAVVDHCQVLVLATPWPEFASVGASLGAHNGVHDLFDCWRQLPPSLATGARVRQVRRGTGYKTAWHRHLSYEPEPPLGRPGQMEDSDERTPGYRRTCRRRRCRVDS